MEETVRIDGSYGEGGGQILRSSLTLSIFTGKPLEIFNIRKGRKNPGLQAQHLTSVRAAKTISSADVSGDSFGSTSLTFKPQKVKAGDYYFNVAEERGSAGSAMLVLQTILLPLSCAEQEQGSQIVIEGGTHVPWSPPFHFISETFADILARIGFSFSFTIEKWGWYPKGQGFIRVKVFPRKPVSVSFRCEERGSLKDIRGISAVSNLPVSIAERQRSEALRLLVERSLAAEISIMQAPSIGPGTFLFLNAVFENMVAGFSALGARGKRAEEVASEAVSDLIAFMDADATIDPHMSDQIVLYLAASGGEHSFRSSKITQHLLTNIWVIKKFLPDLKTEVEGETGMPGKVSITSKNI